MKQSFFVSLLLLPALLWPAAARAAVVRDVLAHASGDRMWIARVRTVQRPAGPADQTDIVVRQSGPGQQWKTLASVPARATQLASRASQLAVLLADGSWQFVWAPDGASTGAALPADGRIRALADDGESMWAVGAVRGGLAAVNESIAAAAPATRSGSLTAGATESSASTRPSQSRLVLFKQQSGAWAALTEFPPEISLPFVEPGAEISLAVIGQRPYVAIQLSDGSIRTLCLIDHKWEDVGSIKLGIGEPLKDFRLVCPPAGLLLWISAGNGNGRLYPQGASSSSSSIALRWIGGNEPESIPAITVAGGYLRVVGVHAGKLYEQRYDAGGTTVGPAAELAIPVNLSDSPIGRWIDGAIIFALTFSVLATLYRRTLQRKSGIELHPPPPAPLGLRAGAGLLDALPVIVTFLVVMIHADPSLDAQERLEDIPAIIAMGSALLLYLLHTTLSEILAGRTLGKWLFGLTTVTLAGTRPGTAQFLVRNALRVLDLLFFPLVLVVISPLRQRSADIAAGTMVARLEDVKKVEHQEPANHREHRDDGQDSGKDAA